MAWLEGKLTRRQFCEALKGLAGVALGAALGIPLGARLVADARAGSEDKTPSEGRGASDVPLSSPTADERATKQRSEYGLFSVGWMPEGVQRWHSLIQKAAERYRVDPALVAVMVLCKSGGSFCAVSREGAIGLIQVKSFNAPGVNLFDPERNLLAGVGYLAAQYGDFGTWEKAITAYDDGPGRVSRGTVTAEGKAFHKWVASLWREARKTKSAAYEAWLDSVGRSLIEKTNALYGDKRALNAVTFATAQWGKSYLWAGEGPDSWDCSALVQAAFRYAGTEIPRTATAQWQGKGRILRDGEGRLPGDLVFFTLNGVSSDHVGMILYQPDVFIEASGPAGMVRVSSLDPASELYRAALAGRILGFKRMT